MNIHNRLTGTGGGGVTKGGEMWSSCIRRVSESHGEGGIYNRDEGGGPPVAIFLWRRVSRNDDVVFE